MTWSDKHDWRTREVQKCVKAWLKLQICHWLFHFKRQASAPSIDQMQISRDVTAKPEAMIKASRVAGIIKQIPVHPQTWFATLQTRMTKCQQHYSTLRDIKENHWLPEAADAKAAGVKVSGFTCLTKLFELSLKLPSERFEPPLAAWLWLHLSCSSAIIIVVYVYDMIWRQWPDM